MARRYSIADARNNLPTLVREAETGTAVELTRRGEPVALLIGRRQYERLTSRSRGFAATYEAFARDVALAALAIDPDVVFRGVRDLSRGREIDL